MFRLVIVMSLITIGKIRGQLANVPRDINVEILPSVLLDSRTVITPEQGRFISLSPQVLNQLNTIRVESTDRSQPNDVNDSDLYLRPLTLRENQPNQRLFIPQRTPDRTSRPDKAKIQDYNSNFEQNINAPVTTQVSINPDQNQPPGQFESTLPSVDKTTTMTDKPAGSGITSTVQNEPSLHNSSQVNGTTNEMNSSAGKPSVANKTKEVEVTLDERASFDGDKCPTGYVRINGMCVEKD